MMDHELQLLINILYGDKASDERVVSSLTKQWESDHQGFRNNMRNAAFGKIKLQEPVIVNSKAAQVKPTLISVLHDAENIKPIEPLRAANDMSAIADFKQAFRQARQGGHKTFFWKKTKSNPSGMFSTELASKQSEKKTETKGLGINTETLLKLKEKTDKLMPETIPADELVRKWIDKGYLPNIRSEEDALEALIEELEAPSKKLERDAAWEFAKAHGNFPGTFIRGEYIPDEVSEHPSFKYFPYQNNYLLNEYRKLYGNIDVNWIQLNIEAELRKEKEAFDERVRKNQEKVQSKKQGGTMNKIKYFAPGGTVSNGLSNGQADAFMKSVLNGDPKTIEQLIQAADQGNAEATQLIQTILQEEQKGNTQVAKAASVIKQFLNLTVSAKWGSKLNYIQKLKGICPEGTEKVYMAKGGCMCKPKAAEGTELKKEKQVKNEVLKFKAAKGCKTKKKK